MKTRSDIQGLRALAVALVVLSHANLLHLNGGYVGVDVFFVISGYLITSIIIREYAANAARTNGLGWFSLRAFYLRRFKRIVPAALLVLIATTAASYLLLNSVKAHGIAIDALWSAFFLANLHFINLATDYFQQGLSTSPLQHFWSLAVEEQFYLIFPTLLLGALSLHGIKIRKVALNWRRRIGIMVGLLSVASLMWAVYATHSSPASSYFSSFSRAWELGLGALLAIFAQSSKKSLPLKSRNLVSTVGLLAILASAYLFTSTTPFPGLYTLIPTLGAAFIIGSGINAEEETETLIQRISNFAPISFLGKISYSVYLWHLPFLVIAGQRYANDSSKLWFKLVIITSILVISTVTYIIYENPLREKIKVPANWYEYKFRQRHIGQEDHRSLLRQNLGYLLGGVIAIIAIALVLLPSYHNQSTPQDIISHSVAPTPKITKSPTAQPTYSADYATLFSAWQQKIKLGNTLKFLPASITPCISCKSKESSKYGFLDILPLSQSAKEVYVYGDSVAFQFSLFSREVFSGWKQHIRQFPGCGVSRSFSTPDRIGASGLDCAKAWSKFVAEITLKKPDLIVVVGSSANNPNFSKTISFLSTRTKSLIYFGGRPQQPKFIIDCLGGGNSLGSNCFGHENANFLKQQAFEKLAVLSNGGIYVDYSKWLCADGECPPVIDNYLVFLDNEHPTQAILGKIAGLFLAMAKEDPKLSKIIF